MIHELARGREQKIVEYVIQNFKDLKEARSDRETVWLDCLEAYLSDFRKEWKEKVTHEHRSARYLSLTFDAVENLVAQLAAMIFPNERWFSILPGRRGGNVMWDDTEASGVQGLLELQHEQMQFEIRFREVLKWLVITGNCPWTMRWHQERAIDYPSYAQAIQEWLQANQLAWQDYQMQMAQYEMVAAQYQMQGMPPPPPPAVATPEMPVANLDIAYEGPELVVGDPFNFVIDDTANNPLSAFRAQVSWRTAAYLRQFADVDETGYSIYENLDKIKDGDPIGQDDYGKGAAIAAAFKKELPNKEAVRLVEAIGDFELPIDDTGGERFIHRNFVAVVANDRTLIRFEPAHLWSREPHVKLATLIAVPGQVYGMGLIEAALGLQDAINVRHNQIIDATALVINPETKAIDDGVFDPEQAESGPGAIHLVGDLNNLQPLERSLAGLQLGFSEIGMMKAEFEQMTRSANPMTTQHYKKSATEIARDASLSGSSLQEIARFIEANALLPMLRMQLQYNQQYLDDDVTVRITQQGEHNWSQVSPLSVRSNWDLRVAGSLNQMTKDKRVQDLLMFFQLASGNPMTAGAINLPYLMRVIYEELGFKDADSVFLPPMMPMMGAMGGGQAGPFAGAPAGPGGMGGAPGFPGVALPDQAPPTVAQLGPYTQATGHGRMGA